MSAKIRSLAALGMLCMGVASALGCGSHSFDVVRTAEGSMLAGGDATQLKFADFAPVTLLDDQIMVLQHIARRQLAHIGVHAVTLTVRNPGATQDLTFLSDVTLSIAAPGMPAKVLATGQNFTAGTNMGVLAASSADFIDYFRNADPTLTMSGSGLAPKDLTLEAKVAFALEVSSSTILFQ